MNGERTKDQVLAPRAIISACGLYRYTLSRDWEPDFFAPEYHGGRALFVMLNPSTADATEDDNTIRRCIAFAKSWGRDALDVVNLYAYRATLPDTLWLVDDPVGPENDDHIERLAEDSKLIVCAWGRPGPQKDRAIHVRGLLENRGPVHYLTLNKDGSPGHPLYLPKALKPTRWL
ncbi:MAG: DUF1643 domain-containing protein [Steroidobacteraceae bacterium]